MTVVGGYIDARGDAAKNSLSLLQALHEEPRIVELLHYCVGEYNTMEDPSTGQNTAILKGIALDLKVIDVPRYLTLTVTRSLSDANSVSGGLQLGTILGL